MIPTYMARELADGRHQELLAEAERHRMIATLPVSPGTIQRLALRVAGWGRRPAVAPRPTGLAALADGPLAI
jgi:hypothetical protein